jgi:hypothetical protein
VEGGLIEKHVEVKEELLLVWWGRVEREKERNEDCRGAEVE